MLRCHMLNVFDGYIHDGRRRERSGKQAFSIQDKEERMSDVCAKLSLNRVSTC